MLSVELTTERLRIRMPEGRDIDAITAACQDSVIQRFTTVPRPYTRAHAEGFVAQTAGAWIDGTDAVWTIESEDTVAGVIGLHHIADGVAELGYWIVPGARGHGIVAEAARSVVDWGFTGPLALHRIGWKAVAGNIASGRTARSLGFRYEGTMRQAFRHGEHTDDGWIAGLLASDDRSPVAWPVLE